MNDLSYLTLLYQIRNNGLTDEIKTDLNAMISELEIQFNINKLRCECNINYVASILAKEDVKKHNSCYKDDTFTYILNKSIMLRTCDHIHVSKHYSDTIPRVTNIFETFNYKKFLVAPTLEELRSELDMSKKSGRTNNLLYTFPDDTFITVRALYLYLGALATGTRKCYIDDTKGIDSTCLCFSSNDTDVIFPIFRCDNDNRGFHA